MNTIPSKQKRPLMRKGFTLAELVVVVAIMIIVTAAVLFKQTQFSSDILITDMAYQIALSVRQSEVYGISSKFTPAPDQQNGFADSDIDKSGYGVHFDPALALGTDSLAAGQSSYATFIDPPITGSVNNTGQDAQFTYEYASDGLTPRTATVSLTNGQKISKYCGHDTSTKYWDCWVPVVDEHSDTSRALDIVFVKPNPEAHITMGDMENGSFTPSQATYDEAKIVIQSGLGDKCRSVSVFASGEIGVDAVDASDPTGCNPPLPGN